MASFTERYHEYTKYNPTTIDRLGSVDWNSQPTQFKDLLDDDSFSLVEFLELLHLEQPQDQLNEKLLTTLGKSNSSHFLAHLLYFTGGITQMMRNNEEIFYFRSNPSAGGLYPVEFYTVLPPSHELGEGLYYFHPLQMALAKIQGEGFWQDFKKALFDDPALDQMECVVLYTTLFTRDVWRYKERSYRRMLLDAGHAMQNTQLFARYAGLGSHIFQSFHDGALADSILTATEEEVPIGILGIHKEKKDCLSLHPGPSPSEAVQRVRNHDSMQRNQNLVERQSSFAKDQFQVHTALHASSSLYSEIPLKIRHRRSARHFSGKGTSCEEIFASITAAIQITQPRISLEQLNLYAVCNNTPQKPSTLYKLNLEGQFHLIETEEPIFWENIVDCALGQELVESANLCLFLTADLNRSTAEWGDRAYRNLCLDAGRIGQTLALDLTDTPWGFSGVGGYFDDLCNQTLELPRSEAILYMACVGRMR